MATTEHSASIAHEGAWGTAHRQFSGKARAGGEKREHVGRSRAEWDSYQSSWGIKVQDDDKPDPTTYMIGRGSP